MFLMLLIVSFLSKSNSSCSDLEGQLLSVIAIYRHGDRMPIKSYRNDPYCNESAWPAGFGQLTNIGKMQQFRLGQWFRKHYKDFLPETYSEKEVYLHSTDVDRTLMSAEANLAGMFPPKGQQIWKTDLSWQPIPIHTTPELKDYILAMKHPCEKYTYLIQKLLRSREFIKIEKENRVLYDYLSKHSGDKIRNLNDLLYLYDTLTIEKLYNLTLPEWTKSVFPDKMKKWAEFSFAVECYTSDLARLKIGPLFTDIVKNLVNAVGNNGYKMVVYSAHDTTIANVLNSLDLFELHWPPYCATLLFELRILNGTFVVNLLYKNSTFPVQLTLKDCNYYCPFSNFTQILSPFLLTPSQWKHECELRFLGFMPYYVLFIFLSILILLIIIFVIIIAYIKMRREEYDYIPLPNREHSYN